MAPGRSVAFLEDELNAVVQAGAYASKEEVIRHALDVLLAAHPALRINTAVELYRQGTVTLERAAEIAALDMEALKDQLTAHRVPVPVDASPTEIQTGTEHIHRLRATS